MWLPPTANIRGATADVANRHTHLAFLIGQHHFTGSKRIQHKLLDLHARRADTLTQVVACRCGSGNNMRFHLEAIAMHPFRIANTILSIDGEAALDHMNDLAIVRNGDSTRLIQSMDNIILLDRISIHSHRAAAIYRGNMRASHAHQSRRDLQPRRGFGFLHRTRNCLGGCGEIYNDALFNSLRRLDTHAENPDGLIVLHPPHQRAHFGRTNVNAYNNFFHVIE
jgi:hypothetical protein